jgi:asparagine synthase (glutamine-hydrolysing)
MPSWIKNATPIFFQRLSKPLKGSVRYKLNRAHNVCLSSNLDFNSRYLAKAACIDRSIIEGITGQEKVYPAKDFLEDFMKQCTYIDPFYKLMFLNFKLSLPDDMLVKVDRMSMASSLETRTPFLDHRLIEYMINVHKDVKMNKYQRKTILRNTVGTRLPQSLLKASKKGFRIPLREWFKEDSFTKRLLNLDNTTPFLNNEMLLEIGKINKSGKKDYGNFIWMLFVLNESLQKEYA